MKLKQVFVTSICALTLASLVWAAKNPMVGGKEMFPNKDIIDNAVIQPTTPLLLRR